MGGFSRNTTGGTTIDGVLDALIALGEGIAANTAALGSLAAKLDTMIDQNLAMDDKADHQSTTMGEVKAAVEANTAVMNRMRFEAGTNELHVRVIGSGLT